MEQIVINHEKEYIHENLGITDERADELEKEIKKEVLKSAVENGIVQIDEKEGSVTLSAARVLDFLINKVAKTTQEQLFLMMHVDPLTRVLDQHIQNFGGGHLEADEQ